MEVFKEEMKSSQFDKDLRDRFDYTTEIAEAPELFDSSHSTNIIYVDDSFTVGLEMYLFSLRARQSESWLDYVVEHEGDYPTSFETNDDNPWRVPEIEYLRDLSRYRVGLDMHDVVNSYDYSQEGFLNFLYYYSQLRPDLRDLYDIASRIYKMDSQITFTSQFLIKSIDPNYIYTLKYALVGYGYKYITLTTNNIDKVLGSLNKVLTSKGGTKFSDTSISILVNPGNIVAIYKTKKVNKHGNPINEQRGRLFPYINTSSYDLTRYQIISDPSDTEICNEHCLIYAFRQLGLDEPTLNKARSLITTANYPKNRLREMAILIKRHIYLRFLEMQDKTKDHNSKDKKVPSVRPSNYGEGLGPTIEISLFMGHYFIHDTVICKGKRKDVSIFSIRLIQKLFNEGQFIPFTRDKALISVLNKTGDTSLSVDHQTPISEKVAEKSKTKSKDLDKIAIVFADTEATTNNVFVKKHFKDDIVVTKAHVAFAHGFVLLESDKAILNTTYKAHFDDLVKACRSEGYTSAIVYYHNLKYDFGLMKRCKDLRIRKIISKSSNYYSICMVHNGFKITLRDSYKLISSKLADFQKNFKLNIQKQDFFLYDLYTNENTTSGYRLVNVAYLNKRTDCTSLTYYEIGKDRFIKSKITQEIKDSNNKYIILDERIILHIDSVKLLNSLVPGKTLITLPSLRPIAGYLRPGMYHHMVHCDYYLTLDCLVLKAGIKAFRDSLLATTGLDAYKFLTISSMGEAYAFREGSYNDVYSINNTTRNFLTKCMAGGRVCTRFNRRHIAMGRIEDYDGISLYPSAMKRLCKEYGLPRGPFKVIRNRKHFNRIMASSKTIYYFVEIVALQDTKKQQIAFPRISVKDEATGIDKIVYTNKINGKTLHLGRIALEDLIQFCELKDYQFIKGIYWEESADFQNNGRNTNLGPAVERLFDARCVAKKAGNIAASTAIKLMMNSVYGKTLLGRAKEEIVCVDKGKFHDYLVKNASDINSFEAIGQTVVFHKEYEALNDYNEIHIGCMILDMSKRIMNEVLSVAEDENVIVLYTDTDSMHIIDRHNSLDRLKNGFKRKYGRDLDGNQLGQFHSDFNFEGHWDIYAVKSIIVDKKMYCDILVGTTKDPKTGELIQEYTTHFRFKGINEDAMYEQADEEHYDSIEAVYMAIAKGELVEFNLCAGSGVSFDMSGNVPVSREEMLRKIQLDSGVHISYYTTREGPLKKDGKL